MSKSTDYAYAAGIIDGEGCIQIYHSITKNGVQSWKLGVSVDATAKKMTDKMAGIFGGFSKQRNPRPIEHYIQYRWQLYGKKAYNMLKKIKPYLVEKKAQADLAIQFYIHQSRCKYYAGKKLSRQILEKRETMQQRLKDLKIASLTSNVLAETKRRDAVMGEAIVQPN